MAAIIWTDVTSLPGAADLVPPKVSVVAQTMFLAFVNEEALDPDVFGGESSTTLKLARCYLAAHMAVLAGRGNGAAGPIVSSTAGRLSRSYANVAGTHGQFGDTAYGELFEQMLASLPRTRTGFTT